MWIRWYKTEQFSGSIDPLPQGTIFWLFFKGYTYSVNSYQFRYFWQNGELIYSSIKSQMSDSIYTSLVDKIWLCLKLQNLLKQI